MDVPTKEHVGMAAKVLDYDRQQEAKRQRRAFYYKIAGGIGALITAVVTAWIAKTF